MMEWTRCSGITEDFIEQTRNMLPFREDFIEFDARKNSSELEQNFKLKGRPE